MGGNFETELRFNSEVKSCVFGWEELLVFLLGFVACSTRTDKRRKDFLTRPPLSIVAFNRSKISWTHRVMSGVPQNGYTE